MRLQFSTGDGREKEPKITGKSSVEMSKKTHASDIVLVGTSREYDCSGIFVSTPKKRGILVMHEILVLGGMGLLSRVDGWQTLMYIVLF